MWVDDAWPVSRMNRTVFACQTASQVLGTDCQCTMPRHAAQLTNRTPSNTPAATAIAGQPRIPCASAPVSR